MPLDVHLRRRRLAVRVRRVKGPIHESRCRGGGANSRFDQHVVGMARRGIRRRLRFHQGIQIVNERKSEK